jgi:uncharacterized protein (TIGR02722 family)
MSQMKSGCVRMLTAVLGLALMSGCTMFKYSVQEREVGKDAPLTAGYDQSDLLTWGSQMATEILAHPFPPAGVEKPILVVMGIQNRTSEHIDMKALSDTVTTKMLDTGKIQLVNEVRRDDLLKEQGYQLQNCTPETRTAIGRQLGARYMLTGSLIEIESKSGKEVAASKKKDVYYQLTGEITDLETGLIVLRKQLDRLRRASKPLIGW